MSIHRLELQAAQLGSRLAASILEPLGLGIDCVAFWSDSQTVLRWLNSKTMKFHVFVANRVADILDVTSASQWRYVATDDNPADDCSRRLYGSVVSVTHRWFAGPKFLSQSEENWPVNIVTPEPESADPEVAGPIVICSLKAQVHLHPISILFNDSSSWTKCKRVIARIRRLLPKNRDLRKQSSIGVDELNEAEFILIEFIQKDAFAHERQLIRSGQNVKPTSSLIRLSPYVDDRGIMRVGGRLGN